MRKIADARIREQKAESIQKSLEFISGGGKKGANPLKGLRGITEADFFQKYITSEKGLTFNFDGALIDYKKPKNIKALAEKMGYTVDEKFEKITAANLKKEKGKYAT